MEDDPLQSVYSYVERAYVRLQAGDLITRCLEENEISPLQQLVEGLVLAGPSSLRALREILGEATQRKTQVNDDLHQVYKELEKSLKSYGLRLEQDSDFSALEQVQPERFILKFSNQDVLDNETLVTCLQILKDGQDLVGNLLGKLNLLGEVEIYLQDWLWGVAYHSVHQEGTSPGIPPGLPFQ